MAPLLWESGACHFGRDAHALFFLGRRLSLLDIL